MEENVKGIGDYLAVLRRRRWHVILPAMALVAISVAVTFLLPPVYRSSATILIEEQEIPQELVRSTITSYADQRIQVISQRVMTRANLTNIIERFDLYAKDRQREPQEVIIERLRDNIELEMVSADVMDPRSGRPTQATIAFTLSFEGENPSVTQRVTSELASLFLDENIKNRRQKAAETSDFLGEEANKLAEHISKLEGKLAAFKERNSGRLPDMMQINFQLMDRTEAQMLEVDREMRSLEERKIYLEGELSKMDPSGPFISSSGERILTPAERLRALEAEFVTAQVNYAPDHPDFLRMKREIESLKQETGRGADVENDERKEMATKLAAERQRLQEALGKYSAEHPDVVRLNENIAMLEASLAKLPPEPPPIVARQPDNPGYITLKSQLEAVNSQLAAALSQRDEIKSRLAEYEHRLAAAPEVEREYRELSRDYENATVRYREIKAKQMEAQVGQELEQERKGERFTLLEPPQLPEQPAKPNRPAILFLGVVFSLAGGIGTAAVAESSDHSVRGASALSRLLGESPLGIIPKIENTKDKRRRIRLILLTLFGIIALLLGAAALIHYLWMPLDVLWYAAQRKLAVMQF